MKNFFSQTWVVAGLVVIVLGVVCVIAFKQSNNTKTDETPKEETSVPEVTE